MCLSEISSEAVESYIAERLRSGRRIYTKFGVQSRGQLKPSTVHEEFRVLRLYSQRRGQAEALGSKSLSSGPASGCRKRIGSQTSLHDGERTGLHRARGSQLPETHHRDHVDDRPGLEGVQGSDGRYARIPIPLSNISANGDETLHHAVEEDLGENLEEGQDAVFLSL